MTLSIQIKEIYGMLGKFYSFPMNKEIIKKLRHKKVSFLLKNAKITSKKINKK